MKKFTKMFLSCAAVAALTAAVATTASAEAVALKGQLAGSYEDGKITVTAPADMDAAKEATLLVYDAKKTDRAQLTDADIVGIDQSAAGVAFDNAGLKGAPTEDDGTYTVALGYYDKDGAFKIATASLFGGAGGVLIGDTDLSGDITLGDATEIVSHYLEVKALTGDALAAADTDGSGDITLGDATCIVNYYLESKTGTGNVGQTN